MTGVADERSYTSAELYDLILTLKDATEIGFAKVYERMDLRFNAVENRLGRVEHRLDGMERRLVRIDDRLSIIENMNVAARLQDHELRITRLEAQDS